MFRILLICSYLITSLFSQGQFLLKKEYEIEFLKKQNAFIDLENYYSSIYNDDSTNLETIHNLAFYKYQNKKYNEAIQLYKQTFKYSNRIPIDIYYYLGKSLKIEEKFIESKEYLKTGLSESIRKKNRDYITLFNREIESLDWAIENKNNISNITEIENLNSLKIGSSFGTGWVDSLQYIIIDEIDSLENNKILLYDPKSKSKISIKKNIPSIKIGNISRKYNSNRIYFSNCDSKKRCIISTAEIIDNEIVDIKPVNGFFHNDSITFTMPHYCEINNKKYIIFSSNYIDCKGGLDIYIGEIVKLDSIINIQNITYVNTPFDDITPYYDYKTNYLYFSNSYYNGYGGLDIFKTKFNLNESSKIENLGKPFNSHYNDLYFSINDSIYSITTNRSHQNNCCNSVFYYKTNKSFNNNKTDTIVNSININDTILNGELKLSKIQKIKKLLPIVLYFHNDIPNPKSQDTITNISYDSTYFEYVKLKNEYLINNINHETISIFFDSVITKGYETLYNLTGLILNDLKQGKTIKITIKGYASPLASNIYNKKLSKRRINSIINYILRYDKELITKDLKNKLIIEEKYFGEEMSKKNVNDDPKNKKKSIYSIDAALERKIEIIDINIE